MTASELAELVAVCDVDPDQLWDVASEYNVAGYVSAAEMLAHERLDFIVVAVPHHAGREVITVAAEYGVHVLKEKPFATNVGEAQELATTCLQAGIELTVALPRRFNPVYCCFQQFCDRIGTPFLIDGVYTLDVDPAAGWRGQQQLAGGGCIIDMGYHLVDLLLWYFGLPDRVLAQHGVRARPDRAYDAEDTATINFGYDSGPIGTAVLSRCVAPRSETLRVVGSSGTVTVDRRRLRRQTVDGAVVDSVTRMPASASPATAQIDQFCHVLRGERANTSSPESHVAHAAFIDACYASAQSGRFFAPKELIA